MSNLSHGRKDDSNGDTRRRARLQFRGWRLQASKKRQASGRKRRRAPGDPTGLVRRDGTPAAVSEERNSLSIAIESRAAARPAPNAPALPSGPSILKPFQSPARGSKRVHPSTKDATDFARSRSTARRLLRVGPLGLNGSFSTGLPLIAHPFRPGQGMLLTRRRPAAPDASCLDAFWPVPQSLS